MTDKEKSSDEQPAPDRPDEPLSPESAAVMAKCQEVEAAMKANDQSRFEALAMEFLLLAVAEAEKNPSPGLELSGQAIQAEQRGDWGQAETLRRQAIGLPETAKSAGILCKAHLELAKLLRLLGRSNEAMAQARLAVEAARQCGLYSVLWQALEAMAGCALDAGNPQEALVAADEASAKLEPGTLAEYYRTRVLVLRARCRVATGDLAGAEADLASAREHPWLNQIAEGTCNAGLVSTLASWWEIRAQIEQVRGNHAAVLEALGHAVERRRQVAQLPLVAGPYTQARLANILEQLGHARARTGDLPGAKQSFQEAQEIRHALQLPAGEFGFNDHSQ